MKWLFFDKNNLSLQYSQPNSHEKSISLTLLTALISINAWATIKHYNTNEGLLTNEIWQIIRLPNKQYALKKVTDCNKQCGLN